MEHLSSEITIIGGGVAGPALYLAADRLGLLNAMLNNGMVLMEAEKTLVGGNFSRMIDGMTANTSGDTLVKAFEDTPTFKDVLTTPEGKAVKNYGDTFPPLNVAAKMLARFGEQLMKVMDSYPKSKILTATRADKVIYEPNGKGKTFTVIAGDEKIKSQKLILATGGVERQPDLGIASEKVIPSSEVFNGNKLKKITEILSAHPQAKIVLLGGSHSVFSVANILKEHFSLGEGQVTIVHRDDIKVYFRTQQEAQTANFQFDQERDTVENEVFLRSGIRADSAKLWHEIKNSREQRIKLLKYDGDIVALKPLLDEAEIVITGFGYEPNKVKLYGVDGQEIGPVLENGRLKVDQEHHIHITNTKDELEPITEGFAMGLCHSGVLPGIKSERSFHQPLDAFLSYATLNSTFLLFKMMG